MYPTEHEWSNLGRNVKKAQKCLCRQSNFTVRLALAALLFNRVNMVDCDSRKGDTRKGCMNQYYSSPLLSVDDKQYKQHHKLQVSGSSGSTTPDVSFFLFLPIPKSYFMNKYDFLLTSLLF